MCSPSALAFGSLGVQAATGAFSAVQSIAAGNSKANYYEALASQNESNIRLNQIKTNSDIQSVSKQAALDEAQLLTKQKGFNASVATATAAQGMAGSVTAQDIALSNYSQEKIDELMIRYNADQKISDLKFGAGIQEAGMRLEANQYRMAGDNARTEGMIGAVGTLLTTATSVAGQYAQGKKEHLYDWESSDLGAGEGTLNPDTGKYSTRNENVIGVDTKRTWGVGPDGKPHAITGSPKAGLISGRYSKEYF